MKKWIIAMLAVVLCVSLVACQPKAMATENVTDSGAAAEETRQKQAATQQPTEPQEEPSAEPQEDEDASVSEALADEDEAPVYDTPEEAIEAFAKGIAAQDLNVALQACAIEEVALGTDFGNMAERLGVVLPMQNNAPNEYGLYNDINVELRRGEMSRTILNLCYSFFIDEDMTVPMELEGDFSLVDEFIEKVNPEKLAGLTVLRVDEPVPELLNSEQNLINFEKQAQAYGADELTERVVLYELDGKTCAGGFGLLRYGDGWKIQYLNSNLVGMPAYAVAVPCTEDEYRSLLE